MAVCDRNFDFLFICSIKCSTFDIIVWMKESNSKKMNVRRHVIGVKEDRNGSLGYENSDDIHSIDFCNTQEWNQKKSMKNVWRSFFIQTFPSLSFDILMCIWYVVKLKFNLSIFRTINNINIFIHIK